MPARTGSMGEVKSERGMLGASEKAAFEEMLRARRVGADTDPYLEEKIRSRYEQDLAVMVLDSSGCTRLTRAYGIVHFMSMVLAMRDFVRPIMDEHGVLAHWAEADNVFAMFPAPEPALRCGVAIQRSMPRFNEEHCGPEPLRVCLGIGTGRLLRIGNEDVFGDEMNLASKLGEDIAGPDEVLISDNTFQRVKDLIPDFIFEPGRLELSGLEIPYHRVRF